MNQKAETVSWHMTWPLSLLESVLIVVLIAVVVTGGWVAHKHNPTEEIRTEARVRDEMQAIYIYLLNRKRQLNIPMPTTQEGLALLIGAEGINGVITDIPRDPWNHPYQYRNDQNGFKLFSLGPDGIESGDDIHFGLR